MRPISLNEEEKLKLLDKFIDKVKKEIENYSFNKNSTTLSVKTDYNEEAKEKINIIFSQEAYLRMQALVEYFTTEVGWYGLVTRVDEKVFYVYDVKVCKQYVDGGKVDTEDDDTIAFFESLSDEELDHMHFQAHSHVNMSTSASGVDTQNQLDVIRNMGKEGFYIFQIWNKKGDISTYLYDLDHNVFYDKNDVIIMIEDSLGSIDDFIDSVDDLVIEKRSYPYQQTNLSEYYQNSYYNGGGRW